MKTEPTLTAARLRELMRYEPDGTIRWRELSHPNRKAGPLGAPAGHGGRLQMRIDGRMYYVHRLVWLYHYGVWPDHQVDHENRNSRDNRIENLRDATNGQNQQNRIPPRGGVSFDKRKADRPWRARIMVNERSISLGYYDTWELANEEYQRAKLVYHPFFAANAQAA